MSRKFILSENKIMTVEQIKNSISYCGLICCFCSSDGSCDCRKLNQCERQGCFQYNCCKERGYVGCWECPDLSACNKDMFDDSHLRVKTFVKCIKEDGIEAFSEYILCNLNNGILYHRNGHTGDYDLDTEEAILALLRNGNSA
jgi:hypothetical protein